MIDVKKLVPGAVVTLPPLKVIAHTGDLILVEKNGAPSQWCTCDASKLAQLAVSVIPPPPPPPGPEVGDVCDFNGEMVEVLAAPDENEATPVRRECGLYVLVHRTRLRLVTRAADRAATDGGEG